MSGVVKRGYKQTEVGVIPEDWGCSSIADLMEPSAPICYGVVQVGKHVENGVPIVAIKFVKEIASAPLHHTAGHLEKPYARSRLATGDVLISIKGTIGRVGIVPSGFEGNISRELARLRVRAGTVPEYVAHQLEADSTQLRIMRSVVGTTRLEFSIATLREFPLALPPLPEQRAIADALSDVDALLGALDRLIAKKRDLKQAVMQQLLTGQTRLPGFRGEWEVRRLGDIFEITSSKRVFQSEWRAEGVPFYRARELAVLGETGTVENELFISPDLYDTHRRAYGVPAVGDMLVTGVGTLGKVYVVTDSREFYFKDGNIIWFRIGEKMSSEFLRQLFRTPPLIKQIADGAAGTTVGTYTIGAAKRTTIPFPPLVEQTAIANVLSEMDAELTALTQRREKTQALKQGMMQELLTGRTRLV